MDTQEFNYLVKAMKKAKGDDNVIVTKVKQSVIIRFFNFIGDVIYKKVLSSFICYILTCFDVLENNYEHSKIASFFNKGSAKQISAVKNVKNGFLKQIESSVILSGIRKLIESLGYLSTRTYSYALFGFGAYILGIQAIVASSIIPGDMNSSYIIIAIASLLLGLVLVFVKKPLIQTINDSAIISFVLYDFLGLRKKTITNELISNRKYSTISAFFGIVLGAASFFINPLYIVIGIAALVVVSIIINSCEVGIVLALFSLPFIPTKLLLALMILTTISFFIKLLCGKRSFKLSVIDLFVLLFTLIMLSGGFLSYNPSGSINSSLVYVCFLIGYFLIKNTFKSAVFLDRAIMAMTLGLIIVSFIGILEFFVGSPSTIWQDSSLFGSLKGRVVSTLTNPNMLAEYLIMLFPIAFTQLLTTKDLWKQIVSGIASILSLICLVFTWSRGAWLGLFIATVIVVLTYSKYMLTALALILPPSVVALFLTNSSLSQRITSVINFTDSSTSYRIGIWESTLKLLKDHIWLGIGVGESAFTTVFPYYAISGITSAFHSHSLYLQILVENGIFALVIFLAIIFLFTQKTLSYTKNAASLSNRVRALGMLCSILAMLIMGITDFVWYNYKIFLMFWSIIGLSVANITFAKESVEENRITY